MALVPFATVADIAALWRPLTAEETTRANSLLPLASNRLRLIARDLGIDLDKEAEDEVFKSVLQGVVVEAVKRALQTPQDTPPVDTYQQTAGPYSVNYKYTNPSGDLWFKNSELASIGLYGTQTIGSISTTRKEIYS